MKTLNLIILIAMLILAGGCTTVGESTPVVERSEQLVSSPTVIVPATNAAAETKTELQPTPTRAPTLSPTMIEKPIATSSPTPVETATPNATPTVTPTPAPHVLPNVGSLNLRAGPGTGYQVIARKSGGTQLAIEGRNEGGDWLLVESNGRSGWVSARFVDDAPEYLPALPTPPPPTAAPTHLPPTPTPSPLSPTATPEPTLEATTPPTPAKHSTIVLGPDTTWPVRAERVIGWGYEIVDASEQWDLVLQRDVYGVVAHEFWGEQLYGIHPHGIRITLIDPVWDGKSPSPLAPVPLFADDRGLFEGFGDGAGSMIYVGCAIPAHHFYDSQECFIAIEAGGEHLTDIVAASTVTAQNMLHAGYDARTHDFSQPPFRLLGQAYREGDQWRWRDPFLEVVPVS